jgi:Family of unknown function (DUF6496)
VALGDFIGSLQFYPWRERMVMPREEAIDRAREDAREGKSPSTQASEFVREEIEHVREGKHGARSPQQAIAIGLSKARRAGIKLSPPRRGSVSARTRKQAMRDSQRGRAGRRRKPSAKRSRAVSNALRRESRRTASRASLSAQTRSSARRRGAAARHAAARKAVRTKGRAGLRRAARKAARTRQRTRRA